MKIEIGTIEIVVEQPDADTGVQGANPTPVLTDDLRREIRQICAEIVRDTLQRRSEK